MFQALYLDLLTYYNLLEKIAPLCGLQQHMITNIRLCTKSGVYIAVSDSVRIANRC